MLGVPSLRLADTLSPVRSRTSRKRIACDEFHVWRRAATGTATPILQCVLTYDRHVPLSSFETGCNTHCRMQGLSGWPKLHFQVWSVDADGRTDIAGYGFTNLPTAPGVYQLECPLWVPEGTVGAYTSSEHRECPVVLTPRGHGQVYTLGALQTYGVTDSCSSAHERDAETCQARPSTAVSSLVSCS